MLLHRGNFSAEVRVAAVFVYAFVFVAGVARGAYAARNIQPSGVVLLLYFGLLTAVGYWLRDDAKKKEKGSWLWDMGFFLYLAWPLIMPYYLFKTRGTKAILIIFALIATYVAGHLAAVLILKT